VHDAAAGRQVADLVEAVSRADVDSQSTEVSKAG
jgi:hypothetical protein